MAKEKLNASLATSQAVLTIFSVIVVKSFWGYNNITESFAWYCTYHREPWNQFIHFFGVPGILWSVFIWAVHVPLPYLPSSSLIALPGPKMNHLNFGLVATLIYGISYLLLDPLGGILYAPFLYGMYISAVALRDLDQERATILLKKTDQYAVSSVGWAGTGKLLQLAFFIHCFSWYVQIHPGHLIIEGAKPALMDSLGDALSAAPLFAYHEFIFLVGFRKSLEEDILARVAAITTHLCAAGSTMRACANL